MGTCGALQPELALGDLVIARESICADGASRALGGGKRVSADPGITDALRSAAPTDAHHGAVVSVDLFYDDSRLPPAASDALAIEMEAATIFAVGSRADVPVACVLAVSDTFDASGERTHIDDHLLLAAAESMGAVAVTALGAVVKTR